MHARPKMRLALHIRTAGFSLLEMIMVVIILAIIAALGSNMLSGGLNAYFTGRDLADADWQGRLALERIASDLRSIRSATAADLSISPASQIAFVNKAGAGIFIGGQRGDGLAELLLFPKSCSGDLRAGIAGKGKAHVVLQCRSA